MKTTKALRLVLARHVGSTDSAARRATTLTIMGSRWGVIMMNGGGGRGGRGEGNVSVRKRRLIVMPWRDGERRGRGPKRKSRPLRHRLRSGIANEIGMGIVGVEMLRRRGVRRRM
jgi:hypothetical protein